MRPLNLSKRISINFKQNNNMNHEFLVKPDFGETFQALSNFEATLSRELTPQFAEKYLDSLTMKLGGINQSLSEITQKGEALHFSIGHDIYGGLISSMISDIYINEQDLRYRGPIFFALRDAAPFLAAAKVIMGGNVYPMGIYLNRPLLGIEDEIAPEISQSDGILKEYLSNNHILENGKIILVDTGAWGTVVRALKTTYLQKTSFIPIFWFSHNPYIPGFIDDNLKYYGFEQKYGEILNDSLECVFPQLYKRPTSGNLFPGKSGVDLKLESSDLLSQAWGRAALGGVTARAKEYQKSDSGFSILAELQKLIGLSELSKTTGEWTGVLPDHTPTWSKGTEFIANWPKNLLP
jgi:hypothetical protein